MGANRSALQQAREVTPPGYVELGLEYDPQGNTRPMPQPGTPQEGRSPIRSLLTQIREDPSMFYSLGDATRVGASPMPERPRHWSDQVLDNVIQGLIGGRGYGGLTGGADAPQGPSISAPRGLGAHIPLSLQQAISQSLPGRAVEFLSRLGLTQPGEFADPSPMFAAAGAAGRGGRQAALAARRQADPFFRNSFRYARAGDDLQAPQRLGEIKALFRPAPEHREALEAAGISAPDVYEVPNAAQFHQAISEAAGAHPAGAAVHIYTPEEYAGMRMFLTDDGRAGFALKGDDVVSVFKHPESPARGWGQYAPTLAVAEGGRRLDAFDTVLPDLYGSVGFEPVGRMPFADQYAPTDWPFEALSEFNQGRPDVVAMAYNPQGSGVYERGAGPYFTDYEEMIGEAQRRGGANLEGRVERRGVERPVPGGRRAGDPEMDQLALEAQRATQAGDVERADALRRSAYMGEGNPLRDLIQEDLARANRPAGQVETGLPGTWVSPTLEAVQSAPQDRATATQWEGMLRKNGGFGKAEDIPLREWLEGQGDRVIERSEIEQFVEANRPRLTETTLGRGRDTMSPQAQEIRDQFARVNTELQAARDRGDDAAVRALEIESRLLADAFGRASRGQAPKYESYTQPGGENYREILIQNDVPVAPQIEPGLIVRGAGEREFRVVGRDPDQGGWTIEHVASGRRNNATSGDIRRWLDIEENKPVFRSQHWDQKNVLTHLRTTDRTLPNGDRTLFIEEIQSDWHQAGRERGYAPGPERLREIEEEIAQLQEELRPLEKIALGDRLPHPRVKPLMTSEQRGRMNELTARITGLNREQLRGVPRAPFERTEDWVRLSFRRALQDAAERGLDRVAWVSGEQAADLYDLRKRVSGMLWDGEILEVYPIGGQRMIIDASDPEQLAEYIGKDPARRLVAEREAALQDLVDRGDAKSLQHARAQGAEARISGDDLRVGGEGMQTFYNRIVPNVVKKEAKRLGVEIEPVAVNVDVPEIKRVLSGSSTPEKDALGFPHYTVRHEGVVHRFATEAEAQGFVDGLASEPTNLSIRLTPEGRARILREGQRLGGAPLEVPGGVVGAGVGATAGAATAEEGEEGRGAAIGGAIGGALGIGMPRILRELAEMGQSGAAVLPGRAERPLFDVSPGALERSFIEDAAQGPINYDRVAKGKRREAIRRRFYGEDRRRALVERANEIRAQVPAAQFWYATDPLRRMFIDELGVGAGIDEFNLFMRRVAATSPRTDVYSNVVDASRNRSDLPVNQGLLAQVARGEDMGSPPGVGAPKVRSFLQNLMGNLEPPTFDVHMTNVLGGPAPVSELYGEYARLFGNLAEEAGMPPAMLQSTLWHDGPTLRDPAPFLEMVDRAAASAAQRQGISREEAMRRFIRGDEVLGGLVLAALTPEVQRHLEEQPPQ